MSIPITDLISGSPAGAAPAIRTLAKSQHRKSLRARTVVITPAGAAPPSRCEMFRPGHTIRVMPQGTLTEPDIRGQPVQVDVYRSRRMAFDDLPDGSAWLTADAAVTQGDVDEVERDWLHAQWEEARRYLDGPEHYREVKEAADHFDATGEDIAVNLPKRFDLVRGLAIIDKQWPADDVVDRYIRDRRGDLSAIGWWDSPWQLDWDAAASAGILRLCTEHLYAGVREEHGRWQYYRGLGGHLAIEGTADTREEAEIMARAHLFRAWLARVKEIERARMGDLSWGWPVPSPVNWLELGDPQATY